jgi:endonuclease/exonuclease/phosphatase family metal-dependent hydrolase
MSGHRRLAALAASAALLLGTAPTAADAAVRAPAANQKVEVASYNLYLGGDVGTLLAPGIDTPAEFIAAAAALWQSVVATNFHERAEAIADLLAKDHPHVVGLQEVALWETAPFGAASLSPTYDFLAILRAELADRGTPYKVLATNTNFVSPIVPLPAPIGLNVRLSDRDVIIARSDLPKSELKTSNASSRTYTARVPITLPTGAAEVVRGWSTIDIKMGDLKFRFANTHLEAFSDTIRDLQAVQLARVLRRSPHPVVLVGDINADPGTGAARVVKRTVGMADAWAKGKGKGYTAGQDDLLRNDPSTLSRRIDFVFYESDRRPDFAAKKAHVIGEAAADRTATGMWPSDHAGVWARLRLSPR